MGGEVVIGSIIGTVLGGGIGAGLGALSGVISGSAGAAIMQSVNYTGYDVQEAVHMGAVGGSILSGPMGALVGCMTGALISNGFFKSSACTITASSSVHVIGSVIAGVIGYAVLNAGDYETIMDLEKTAIAFAVGSLATSIPVTAGLICIALPIVLACIFKNSSNPVENMTNMRNLHADYGTMPKI